MPELTTSLPACGDDDGDCDGNGSGLACSLSFGREEGKGDWLSFVISGTRGEEIASVMLPSAA